LDGWISDTVLRVVATATTGALALEAAARREGRLRLAWALLGSYMVLYTVADVLWMACDSLGCDSGLDVANVIYLTAFAPGTLGLLVYPTVRTERGMFR